MDLCSRRAIRLFILPSVAIVLTSFPGQPANLRDGQSNTSPLTEGAGASLPIPPAPPQTAKPGEHPLLPAIRFARAGYDYMRRNVQDFTCVLVKRERIDGHLRGYEFIRTKVRLRQPGNDRVVVPFCVYMQYLSPAKYQGRKVLYTEGKKRWANAGPQRRSEIQLRDGARGS